MHRKSKDKSNMLYRKSQHVSQILSEAVLYRFIIWGWDSMHVRDKAAVEEIFDCLVGLHMALALCIIISIYMYVYLRISYTSRAAFPYQAKVAKIHFCVPLKCYTQMVP